MNDNQKRYKTRVIQAAESALYQQKYVSSIDVLIGMQILKQPDVENWQKGRIPYLERVIQGSLNKISFYMKCFHVWAKEKGLIPRQRVYLARTKGPKKDLRFSKSGDPKIETSYRTHYVSPSPRESNLS